MNEFVVLLHGNYSSWKDQSPSQLEAIMQKYHDWVAELRRNEKLITGSALEASRRVLRTQGETVVVDGPFAESKEMVTGFFMIRAVNLDEAVAIARGCPALTHGDSVEVIAGMKNKQ